jgi:hypothetical protein
MATILEQYSYCFKIRNVPVKQSSLCASRIVILHQETMTWRARLRVRALLKTITAKSDMYVAKGTH